MQSQSKYLKNCRIHNLNFACRPTIKTKSGIEICIHKKYSRHKVKKSFKYDFFVLVQRYQIITMVQVPNSKYLQWCFSSRLSDEKINTYNSY